MSISMFIFMISVKSDMRELRTSGEPNFVDGQQVRLSSEIELGLVRSRAAHCGRCTTEQARSCFIAAVIVQFRVEGNGWMRCEM